MTGPRSLPPIPMFTTLRIGLPVKPVHSPWRTLLAKAPIWSSTCMHGFPSLGHLRRGERLSARRAQRGVQHGAAFGGIDRVAAEHGVDAPRRPQSSASASSRPSVSSVTRFLE